VASRCACAALPLFYIPTTASGELGAHCAGRGSIQSATALCGLALYHCQICCSLQRRGILLKNHGSEDPSVRTTHAARAGKPPAYAERARGKRDWRRHNRYSNEGVGKARGMRGGRSEHHALDVRVGEVERRQLPPRRGVPPPSMTSCGRAAREAGTSQCNRASVAAS